MTRSGRIIAFEGVDAVGKRTQSLLLEAWFKKNGFRVVSLSFPAYETPIGKEIRAFLDGKRESQAEVRHMLFAANRWEKAEEIRRSVADNEIVIVNRYTESNLVYGVANGLRLDWLQALEDGMPKSSLVLVLDAPSKGLLDRRPGPKDEYEKDFELQLRVQKVYRRLAPKFGWKIIDGSKDVQEVHRSILEVVKSMTKSRASARP